MLVGITYKFGTGFNLKCPDCKPVAYRNERYSESYVKSLNDKINELQGAIDSHKCPEPVPCPEVEKSVPGIKSHVSFGWQRRTSPRTSRSTSWPLRTI